jgi:hypothetical protein
MPPKSRNVVLVPLEIGQMQNDIRDRYNGTLRGLTRF